MEGLQHCGNDNEESGASEGSTEPRRTLDLSIVISTRNRPESLCILLDCIVADDRAGVDFEVVVVDNGDSEQTRGAVEAYADQLKLRYFVESRPGKCYTMNRSLDEGGLGEIVAFLDDDLTLEPGWLRGVKLGSDRWPAYEFFSGRSHVVFPEGESLPHWAHRKEFSGWAFSVNDPGAEDHEMQRGFWPSGNHFWVRSRVLDEHRRFPALWILPEPGLILGLQEDGHRGMWIGDVVAGHRVQPHLLQKSTVLLRMAQYGKDFPYVRLSNPNLFRHARIFRDYPLVWVLLCFFNLVRWYLKYLSSFLKKDPDARFIRQITTTVRIYDNLETFLRWRRIQRFISGGRRLSTARQEEAFGRFYDRA